MPLPSLSLLSRDTWPFRSGRPPRPERSRTEAEPAGGRHGREAIADVANPRHVDNSARAEGIRSEYRRVMRGGDMPPRPARPPAFDDAATPPAYQATPGAGEITVDHNARGPQRDLRHAGTASQGLAEPGSEHYRDFANPFRSMSSGNQPAPRYPETPRDVLQDLRERHPQPIRFLPFPHEKEIALAEALRGRAGRGQPGYQPPSDRAGAPRQGPAIAPRRRGIDWCAIGRGLIEGLASIGGPMGRM